MTDRSLEHELQAVRRQRRAFWALLIFAVVFLPILISLGIWQLNRAAEKELLLKTLDARKAQAPLISEQLESGAPDLRYRRVDLSGFYDATFQWLLDNRTHAGRFGYEVISAFRLEPQSRWILVNRGWIAASPRREVLPELPVPEGLQRLRGYLDDLGGKPVVLRETPSEPGWPKRVQSLNVDRSQADVQLDFLPWQVRLDGNEPGALIPAHVAPPMGPATHRGYAVQWFGLATVLLIGSLIALTRR